MRCSVVFGVTLRLFVINILPSSPTINTAAYCSDVSHSTCVTVAVVHRRPCWQHRACCSANSRQVSQIGSESRFLPTPPAFDAPVRGVPVGILYAVWYVKLEWLGYPMVKKFRRYVYSFWQNARTWRTHRQTDRQTDTARRHRPRLHSIARQNEMQDWKPVIYGVSVCDTL